LGFWKVDREGVKSGWRFIQESLIKEFEGSGLIAEGLYSDVCGKPFSEDTPDMDFVARKP